MRDLSASVEQVVQRLAAEQLSAVVAAAAVVEGGHCSPFELLYALGDVNTYTFPCGNEPETIINIKCQNTGAKHKILAKSLVGLSVFRLMMHSSCVLMTSFLFLLNFIFAITLAHILE